MSNFDDEVSLYDTQIVHDSSYSTYIQTEQMNWKAAPDNSSKKKISGLGITKPLIHAARQANLIKFISRQIKLEKRNEKNPKWNLKK